MDNMDRYIGQLLDNRYEILEKIGVGGMAVVYKALCHRLNRYVAIKILKDELAVDEDFRRRFHTESQAVAMLSHSNIVTVYDVSKNSNLEYIVMELIDGITLKQYMQKRGVLTWKETLHFSSQIAKALSHAHSRGIIHRDIKPHNIMILKDSSVKVADFGIARLQSTQQNTLTQETLGSVHYISPEQAKGGHIDARTDIYSLGVMMYEMLTGRLPFEGDSAVSIAIQHISSIPLMPREINPDIPVGLESITMRAMNPDLEQRYQSADALFNDLEEFRKNPEMNFDYNELAFTVPGLNDEEKQDEPSYDRHEHRRDEGSSQRYERDVTPVSRKGELSREEYVESNRRARRVSILTGIFCVIAFMLLIFVLLWNYWIRDIFTEPEQIQVPQFIGQRLEDVLLNPNYTSYFNILPTYEASDSVESGYIMAQTPMEGRTAVINDRGIDVQVTVSSGNVVVQMPDVVNKEYRQAIIDLERQNLEVRDIATVTSDTVTEGYVISTDPVAGTDLKPGDSVFITVSGGPEIKYTDMPALEGYQLSSAVAILESMNLTPGSTTPVDSELDEGVVVFQSVAAGTQVPEHTRVNLSVSNGKLKPSPSIEPSPSPSGGPNGGEMQPSDQPVVTEPPVDEPFVTDPSVALPPSDNPQPQVTDDENAVVPPDVADNGN